MRGVEIVDTPRIVLNWVFSKGRIIQCGKAATNTGRRENMEEIRTDYPGNNKDSTAGTVTITPVFHVMLPVKTKDGSLMYTTKYRIGSHSAMRSITLNRYVNPVIRKLI